MRIFWLSGIGLVCLLLAACGRQQLPAGVKLDPAFRTLVAPDTKLLSGIDWDSLKTTAFYHHHENDLNIPIFKASAERLGVDPLRDVSKVLVAWDGHSWLFLERGHWNANDLQKKMIAAGAQSTNYRNRTLIGNRLGAVAFFKTITVEGNTDIVRKAIDLESAGSGEIPEELQERLRTLPSRDQLWTVSRAGLAYANLPTNPDIQSALSNITGSVSGTTAGMYVDTGLHISIDLQCVSDQGATRVHDALRGIIGFGRLSTKDDQQDLLRAYDAIQVEKKNQTVEVRADLPEDLADKLLGALTSLRHKIQ